MKSFIAKGGIGAVYKGIDKQLNRFVAIKVLKNRDFSDVGARERFLLEGQTLAKVNHPNIVQIYDIGEEAGYYYIIMEYIEGENLGDFIKKTRAEYKTSSTLPLMIKISNALAVIHEKGILHRDIKPANIMVDTSDNPKLMDFGIAKSKIPEAEEQSDLTREGSFLGTAEYMAPEQFSNPGRVGSASDVYSLGCTFYKLLTGRNPIPGNTFFELHKNHLNFDPIPIGDITESVPFSLCNIIHKMMDKKPEKRYRDGDAVKNALLKVKKKTIPGSFIKLFGGFLIVFFGIVIFSKVFKPETEWFPKPRTIAVIPFAEKASQYSFVSTEFTKLLKSHYNFYNTVERGDIFQAMEELKLNQTEFISKEDSLRIGKLVGAHIFVMFEVKNIKEKEVVYPKAFDVETLLLLGLARIPTRILENYEDDNTKLKLSLDEIMKGVADELVYRSYVDSIDGDETQLEHGRLHGASLGMKIRVLDRKSKAIGVLEITAADKNTASAKIISGTDVIKKGLRVEEIKDL